MAERAQSSSPRSRAAAPHVLRAHVKASGGLASLPDLARCWHLSDTRVRTLSHEPGFPEPFDRVGGGKIAVYLVCECNAWKHEREQRFRPH